MPCQPACPVSADTWAPSAVPDVYRYADLHLPQQIGQASLAAECALAISYNGLNQAVMMASPEDIEDFVRGFSLSSGFVQAIDEIYEIRVSGQGESLHAEVEISSRAFWNLKRQRRQLAGTSGCGLCGVEALEQALP
ncbi:formate dehydrogenase accessory sulfurtransferase FdhD, partial [Pseudomonas aeruginosa]